MPRVKGIPNVRFTLHSTKDPLKKTYILLYFHYQGKRLKYTTGEKVCPDGWDFTRQRAISSRKYPQGVDINETLNKLENLTVSIYRSTNLGEIEPKEFSKELDIRMGYARREEGKAAPTLLTFTQDWVTKYSEQNPTKRSTWKTLFLTLKQLKDYASDKGVKLEFSEIDNEFLSDLIAWLYAPPRVYSRNYVAFVVKRLKMFMQKAYEQGLHDNRVYLSFKYTEIDSDEISLSFEEINAIAKLDLSANGRYELARDVFLVGCFTGQRFSDYSRIKPEHIVHEGGIKVISIVTKKTGSRVKIPLFPILEKILKKYNFKVPKIREDEYRPDIKEVCKLAGITENILIKENRGNQEREEEVPKYSKVTTHTPRRSFASNFILAKIPIHLVMAILGHKTEAETRKYARISESQAAQGFNLEVESLKDSPVAGYLFE